MVDLTLYFSSPYKELMKEGFECRGGEQGNDKREEIKIQFLFPLQAYSKRKNKETMSISQNCNSGVYNISKK